MTGTRRLVPALLAVGLLAGCSAASTAPTPTNPTVEDQQDVTGFPDYSLDDVPAAPVSPQFVLEHRSALDGRTIRIRGTVLRLLTPVTPTPGVFNPQPGGYFVPRVFLDAGPAGAGEPNNELMVLLRDDDTAYSAGQIIEVDAIVHASSVAIAVFRVYPDN